MGFFFAETTKTSSKKIDNILASEYGCKVCTFNNSEPIKPIGTSSPVFYFLGDFPRNSDNIERIREDLYNITDDNFEKNYIRWNNCIRCIPTKQPTDFELNCCKNNLIEDIEKTKPLIVIGFGEIPLQQFLKGNTISLWVNRLVPIMIGTHKCWYFVTYNPSFLLAQNKNFETEYDKFFRICLKNVINFILYNYEEPEIIIPSFKDIEISLGNSFEEFKKIKKWLKYLSETEVIAFDIETHGIRPYDKTSKILSIALSDGKKTFSFPLNHPEAWNIPQYNKETIINSLFEDIKNLKCEIIAHNLKFELEWLFAKYNDQDFLRNKKWNDTMIQAYLLDERTSKSEKMLSLDKLTFLNFGFNLKEQTDINIKKIIKTDLEQLLIYNGMDAKYTYKLFFKQKPKLQNELINIYKNLINTTLTLVITQNYGLNFEKNKAVELLNLYENELLNLQNKMDSLDEVKKLGYKFNPLSTEHLVTIFKDILKLEKVKETPKKGFSTDDEVLNIFEEQGIKLASLVKKFREIYKLKSTYVENAINLEIDGKLHPQYNLLFTSTGRLSSGRE